MNPILYGINQRIREGWLFYYNAAWPVRIGANNRGIFSSDDEAHAFVLQRAKEGSEYHQIAIAAIAETRLRGHDGDVKGV